MGGDDHWVRRAVGWICRLTVSLITPTALQTHFSMLCQILGIDSVLTDL
jgi:hypothetical protein